MNRTAFARAGVLLGLFLYNPVSAHSASTYRPGDIIEDFTLVDRSTRQPVRLSDLAGSIVFLEWFAWWCPFCQASAPQVEAGIAEWYTTRRGNSAGIPVRHVAINLQPNQEIQTGNFVTRAGFEFVLEDFQRTLANRFQSGGQPIFAIINGVTNSPSHQPWELLAHQDGYGQRDFTESLAGFRAAIDGVQAAPSLVPPTFAVEPEGGEVEEGGPLSLRGVAMGTPPLIYQWFLNGAPIEGGTSDEWRVPVAVLSDQGGYTLRASNEAGSVTSRTAQVTVRPRKVPEPRLTALGWTDGQLRVEVMDTGAGRITLERSTDFLAWETWEVLQSDTLRQEILVPAGPVNAAAGFFRVRSEGL